MSDQFPKTIGNPSKLGIIVHELFHLANPKIVDHYYGYTHSISSPLPLDACQSRRHNTKCIDMYQIMQHRAKNKGTEILPIESSKVNDWKLYQMEAGKKVNLNMYTADCLRFLIEDAFLHKSQPTSNNYMTYLVGGVASVFALGLGYWGYQHRQRPHLHAN